MATALLEIGMKMTRLLGFNLTWSDSGANTQDTVEQLSTLPQPVSLEIHERHFFRALDQSVMTESAFQKKKMRSCRDPIHREMVNLGLLSLTYPYAKRFSAHASRSEDALVLLLSSYPTAPHVSSSWAANISAGPIQTTPFLSTRSLSVSVPSLEPIANKSGLTDTKIFRPSQAVSASSKSFL